MGFKVAEHEMTSLKQQSWVIPRAALSRTVKSQWNQLNLTGGGFFPVVQVNFCFTPAGSGKFVLDISLLGQNAKKTNNINMNAIVKSTTLHFVFRQCGVYCANITKGVLTMLLLTGCFSCSFKVLTDYPTVGLIGSMILQGKYSLFRS